MKKILAVIALACPLAAHAGIYLKIDAIKGESTNDRHKGEIDISSMQFGIGRTGQTARVCPTEVVMTKAMDSASAPLVAAAMTTTVFPKAKAGAPAAEGAAPAAPAADAKPVETVGGVPKAVTAEDLLKEELLAVKVRKAKGSKNIGPR